MKKQVLLLFSFSLICLHGTTQNLALNPSSELNSCIPNGVTLSPPDYNNCVTNWIIPTLGTSDYFHSSSTNTTNDVPANLFGTQAARTGNAYSGIYTYEGPCDEWREYLRVPLSSPLNIGGNYTAEMYISLCDNCSYVTNNLGMLFTNVAGPAAGIDCGGPGRGVMSQPAGSQLYQIQFIEL